MRAGGRRSGEEQPVDIRRDQRRAGLARALYDLQHVFGQTSFAPGVRHRRADRRGQFGRLEHHRVPGEQRGHDMAIGQVAGEVVRPQHRHHPVRAVAQDGFAERHRAALFARAFGLGGDRQFDLADHRADFLRGFPQRLAGFARDQLGEVGGARLQHGGIGARDGHPFRDRGAPPVAKRHTGARDRCIDIRAARDRTGPDGVARRRAGRGQHAHAAFAISPRAATQAASSRVTASAISSPRSAATAAGARNSRRRPRPICHGRARSP